MKKRLYNLSHATWVCDYHIVWCPKYRGKILNDNFIKQELKRQFKYIAKWKSLRIHAWHVDNDHIHLYLSIPPKYSVSYTIQILKGKTSTWIKKKTKKFPKGTLWNRGYYVSTTGLNEHQIKNYINNQNHYMKDLPTLF